MTYDKMIKGITSDEERAFYGSKNTSFSNITIKGDKDGESAFKESNNIEVVKSSFLLRYPFWHNTSLKVKKCIFESTSRAAFWYDDKVAFDHSTAFGVKMFRECSNIKIKNSEIESEEIGWKCKNVRAEKSKITGFYAFFQSKNIKFKEVQFKGKYSFQYTKNVTIEDSYLDTKDAFWHAENVYVKNCTVKGEYLAWYANGITFEGCTIIGTQPICYSKNIKFINCQFVEADLAFEYSEVNGNLFGTLISIKNPLAGEIVIDEIPEMIVDENDRSNGNFSIRKSN